MSEVHKAPFGVSHDHVYLGAGHDSNERKTWGVIALCGAMMVAEIVGGSLFGSLALVADGLHMSTHAGAMLIAALAYTYARKHANDRRFVFGTGKLGDLAGFTSAIILAMIALLIGYEAVARFLSPVPIRFSEAIPIAVVGLLVNVASAWLLSGGDHHGHSHGHGHAHDLHEAGHGEEVQCLVTPEGIFALGIHEDGVPPVFRIRHETEKDLNLSEMGVSVTTIRPDGARQAFSFVRRSSYLESTSEIPEPHAFKAVVVLPTGEHIVDFAEHDHDTEHAVDGRDHNMRAAYVHIIADAAVSVLTIVGLVLARSFGWLWMDPLAGAIGAVVIANWSYGLVRDTGRILMDVSPDGHLESKMKAAIEADGDQLVDLHVWRLGPGHLGAVASVVTSEPTRGPDFYHSLLQRFSGLSHVTVEVHSAQ
jgi:cation diffusion facilitator family transporter